MALQTSTEQCPKCQVTIWRAKLDKPPYLTLAINAAVDATGHVIETGVGTGKVLLVDRSDAGGADVYKAHHITCSG